ncbi:MAG: glycosyltransferase family 2 protein [Chlamydiales bacterium]|nr:glycosyltransferase family 2 protein [Chlamydiales bacterium]
MSITVTILTKNSAKYLPQVLAALSRFDEVLVYDTGSTDETLKIASQHPNVRALEAPFVGFGPTHNNASVAARNDWILSVDSDEVMTPELSEEIAALTLDPQAVYSVWRQNYYNGRWIRWCGWYPDRQVKLYNRKTTRFSDAQVHEAVITKDLKTVPLKYPVKHYPYSGTADFLAKMQIYSTLYAQQAKGKKSSVTKAVTHGLFAFFKSYILKKGFLGGREGFIISIYNGNTAFYKYLKLLEANRTPSPSHPECSLK